MRQHLGLLPRTHKLPKRLLDQNQELIVPPPEAQQLVSVHRMASTRRLDSADPQRIRQSCIPLRNLTIRRALDMLVSSTRRHTPPTPNRLLDPPTLARKRHDALTWLPLRARRRRMARVCAWMDSRKTMYPLVSHPVKINKSPTTSFSPCHRALRMAHIRRNGTPVHSGGTRIPTVCHTPCHNQSCRDPGNSERCQPSSPHKHIVSSSKMGKAGMKYRLRGIRGVSLHGHKQEEGKRKDKSIQSSFHTEPGAPRQSFHRSRSSFKRK